MTQIGYLFRGGFNIPFRRSFTVRTAFKKINLHVFEQNDPEIELNLLFRNYLNNHPKEKKNYAKLKYNLISKKSSHLKNDSIYTSYTLGKHSFIQSILRKAGFDKTRFVLCTHEVEWETAKNFRRKYFFDLHGIDDPYTWTFGHTDHIHLVLYQATEIIGYAHLKLCPHQQAAIRIIIIDEVKRNNKYDSQLLTLCEKWLKSHGYRSLHVESSPNAVKFYLFNNYVEMPFNNPDGYESYPEDTALGKIL